MRRNLFAAVAFVALVGGAFGQCATSLPTTFAQNQGTFGNMFDVRAINDLTICSFDVNVDAGQWNMVVYALPTQNVSYLVERFNPPAWGPPIATTTVTSTGGGQPTPMDLTLNLQLPAGNFQALYIACTSGQRMNHTFGAGACAATVGGLLASDANLEIFCGNGMGNNFGSYNNASRAWNGNVIYCPGLVNCPPPAYQPNQSASSADIDGVQGGGSFPAITTVCLGATVTVTLGTNLTGNLFDAYVDIGLPIPGPNAPAIVFPASAQVVNVNLASSTGLFLNGGVFAAHPGGIVIPVVCPTAPVTATIQQAVLDPSNADGVALSQAAGLECGGNSTAVGPLTDDTFVQYFTTTAPLCGPGPIPFCGTSYTSVFVSSNGRLTFGAGDANATPTVAEGISDAPEFGWWTDLNPAAGGGIIIGVVGNAFVASWVGVPYFGTSALNSFTLSIDTNGTCVADLFGCVPNPTNNANGDAQFLGISCGLGLATDPGPVTFTAGGSGTNAIASDMIYDFWSGATVTAPNSVSLNASIQDLQTNGTGMVSFTPVVGGTYTWSGF
ncbi:MAG: hypothetical protein CMJ83_17820 [Planctomycetes bacterium]|nr:hypothetical protein [Planctomycetota bacterium]